MKKIIPIFMILILSSYVYANIGDSVGNNFFTQNWGDNVEDITYINGQYYAIMEPLSPFTINQGGAVGTNPMTEWESLKPHRVEVYNDKLTSTLVNWTATNVVNGTYGIAYSNDRIFISDEQNDSLLMYDLNGNYIESTNGTGDGWFNFDKIYDISGGRGLIFIVGEISGNQELYYMNATSFAEGDFNTQLGNNIGNSSISYLESHDVVVISSQNDSSLEVWDGKDYGVANSWNFNQSLSLVGFTPTRHRGLGSNGTHLIYIDEVTKDGIGFDVGALEKSYQILEVDLSAGTATRVERKSIISGGSFGQLAFDDDSGLLYQVGRFYETNAVSFDFNIIVEEPRRIFERYRNGSFTGNVYNFSSLSPLISADTSIQPRGIAYNGSSFFISMNSPDMVYEFSKNNFSFTGYNFSVSELVSGIPRCLALNPSNTSDLWVSDAGEDGIYNYDTRSGKYTGRFINVSPEIPSDLTCVSHDGEFVYAGGAWEFIVNLTVQYYPNGTYTGVSYNNNGKNIETYFTDTNTFLAGAFGLLSEVEGFINESVSEVASPNSLEGYNYEGVLNFTIKTLVLVFFSIFIFQSLVGKKK